MGHRGSILSAGLCIAVGCQRPDPGLQERKDLRDAWQHTDVAGGSVVEHPSSVTVVQGQAPLIYQMTRSGIARIHDATTVSEIASVPVSRGSIVRIDEDSGVFADGRRLRSGPLPPGHGYTISLDLERADSWRSGVETSKPPELPKPIKRPAQSPGQ